MPAAPNLTDGVLCVLCGVCFLCVLCGPGLLNGYLSSNLLTSKQAKIEDCKGCKEG